MKSRNIKTVGQLKEWLKDLDDDIEIFYTGDMIYVHGQKRWRVSKGVVFDRKRVTEDNIIIERPTKKTLGAKLGVII